MMIRPATESDDYGAKTSPADEVGTDSPREGNRETPQGEFFFYLWYLKGVMYGNIYLFYL